MRRMSLVLLAVVLVAGACGGDDDTLSSSEGAETADPYAQPEEGDGSGAVAEGGAAEDGATDGEAGQATTTASGPVGGGDEAVTEFLGAFGLPPNFLNDEQLACVTEQLEEAFPEGIPEDLTLNTETIELFDEVGAACGIGNP